MTFILLAVIYITFICIGVPESLFGAAMEAIGKEFALGEAANLVSTLVTTIVYGCTALASVLAARVINRFGTYAVTAISVLLMAFTLLGFSFAPNIIIMYLLAIPLGVGSGAINASLNNYIALHFSAKHMNFLHCFYGAGTIISLEFMSRMLANEDWRGGYRAAFMLQAGIALIVIVSLPLWKKKSNTAQSGDEEVTPRTLSILEMAKNSSIRTAWIMCISTNAIEALCGVLGAKYLIHVHGMSDSASADALMFYFVGMTLGRFLSGVLADKLGSWRMIRICIYILTVAVVMLLLPLGIPALSIAALAFIGFANGPIYPNIMNLAPQNFGRNVSGSVIGTQMATAYFGVMLAPPLFGIIADAASIALLPVMLAVWLALLIIGTVILIKKLKAQGRYR
ncbi:MAG: MFS transporter [Clostridia bacterium]|nr:MFS transporter [Clostridia bacterium]